MFDVCVSMYKPICSAAERQQYKRDFGKEYNEYLHLHKKTEQRLLIFNELGKSLKQHSDGSPEYEVSIFIMLIVVTV
jgi:Occludin homology domain